MSWFQKRTTGARRRLAKVFTAKRGFEPFNALSYTYSGAIMPFWPKNRYHPLGCRLKRRGWTRRKEPKFYVLSQHWKTSSAFCWMRYVWPSDWTGYGAKNGQIVIMLYAFQDILAKYLNSHLPVIVKTNPSYPLKWQTLHSWQLAWVQLRDARGSHFLLRGGAGQKK